MDCRVLDKEDVIILKCILLWLFLFLVIYFAFPCFIIILYNFLIIENWRHVDNEIWSYHLHFPLPLSPYPSQNIPLPAIKVISLHPLWDSSLVYSYTSDYTVDWNRKLVCTNRPCFSTAIGKKKTKQQSVSQMEGSTGYVQPLTGQPWRKLRMDSY